MKALTVKQVETKLKRLAAKTNARRTENAPIDWRNVASLPWQTRNMQFKGCNGNCLFDPVSFVATSYNWWIFVRLIKGKVVFDSHRYSVTTSGHQRDMRALLRDLGVKIDLEVDLRCGLQRFESEALPSMYSALYTLEIASERRNAKDRSKDIRALKRDIKLARTLGAKCTREQMQGIKAKCLETEARRLAELAEKREEKRAESQATRGMVNTGIVADLSALKVA